MRVHTREVLEDCVDGSLAVRYGMDEAWTRDGIVALAGLGRLEYFAHFPRPMFRLRTGLGLEVKAVEGEDTCRLTLPRNGSAEAERQFADRLAGIRTDDGTKGGCDGSQTAEVL